MRASDVADNDPGRCCSPCHRMPLNTETRLQNASDDVASNVCRNLPQQGFHCRRHLGTARSCLPRHQHVTRTLLT